MGLKLIMDEKMANRNCLRWSALGWVSLQQKGLIVSSNNDKKGVWFKLSNKKPSINAVVDIWSTSHGRLTNYVYKKDYQGKKGNSFFDPYKCGVCCVRDATHWMYPPEKP